MEFTIDMLSNVIQELKHPELKAMPDEDSHLDHPREVLAVSTEVPRPAGRHYRDDSERPIIWEATDKDRRESSLTASRPSNSELDLYTPARDYIVSATNKVVRRLERAG